MLNQKQVANLLGITDRAVRLHVKNGVIPPMPDGGYSGPDLIKAWVIYKSRPTTKGQAKDSDKVNFGDEKALRERAERHLAEIKVEKEEGRLLDAATVTRCVETALVVHRNKLLSIGPTCAMQIMALKTPDEVSAFLSSEVRRLLTEVVNELSSSIEECDFTGTDTPT